MKNTLIRITIVLLALASIYFTLISMRNNDMWFINFAIGIFLLGIIKVIKRFANEPNIPR